MANGTSILDWINKLSDMTWPEIQAIADDPKTPMAKRLAAEMLMKATKEPRR